MVIDLHSMKRESLLRVGIHSLDIRGLFGIYLFCWNWKFFAKSIV